MATGIAARIVQPLSGVLLPRHLSATQIDKLGDRLRRTPLAEEDRALLQQLILDHDAPLSEAQETLRAVLGLESTGRLKTEATIVEKLRRQTTRLSRLQDIAGLRLLDFPATRLEQDEVARKIRATFRIVDEDDRRYRPSFGYRAHHLVAEVDGCRVEIQVRTPLQHAWAESYEKLADVTDRDIRYGVMPSDPQLRDLVEMLQDFAERGDQIEHLRQRALLQATRIDEVEREKVRAGPPSNPEAQAAYEAELADLRTMNDEQSPLLEGIVSLEEHLIERLRRISEQLDAISRG